MKFEDKLIKLRKEKGLSQEELGNEINVSRQAISKWESGQVKPEIEKIKELSTFFDVSTDYLIKEEIEENEPVIKKKSNKKRILKIVKTALLAIIVLYLIIVIYRFSILMVWDKKIENMKYDEEYKLQTTIIINDKLTNQVTQSQHTEIHKNRILYSELYTNFRMIEENGFEYMKYDSTISEIPTYINYINLDDKKSYNLMYDFKLGKYVYSNLEDLEDLEEDEQTKDFKIQDETEFYANNYINLKTALDLRIKINMDVAFINIREKFKDGHQEIIIDRETGFISEIISVDSSYQSNVGYDFTMGEYIEDSEIVEPNVDYIVLEKTE